MSVRIVLEASGPTPRPAGLLGALSEMWPLKGAVAPPAVGSDSSPPAAAAARGLGGRCLWEQLLAEDALPRASVPS